jgi:hypothetical protein
MQVLEIDPSSKHEVDEFLELPFRLYKLTILGATPRDERSALV